MDINKLPKDVARVDIEKAGQTMLSVRVWLKGFSLNDAGSPAFEDMIDISMLQACKTLEDQGFAVTVYTKERVYALRGPVTRVDFVKQNDGWHIKKYPYGWKASTQPMSDVVKTEEEIKQAIQWCKDQGWTIYDFEGEIIRAWKGKPIPVHDTKSIKKLRAKYPRARQYDFAYHG